MNNKIENPRMVALRLKIWSREAKKRGMTIHDFINTPKDLIIDQE